MSDISVEMDHVFKKFKKGEIFDSLRDLIPSLARKLFRNGNGDRLKEREFWALSDVSFQVGHGEALGIIGSNGAGKSTILKLLCGVMKPTKGEVRVNGTMSALIELGAGFHPDLTGRENIFLNGTIVGMKKAEIKRKFDEIVDFSGLSEFIDTPVKRYSSGMYARLGFSVAAHVDPNVMVVDEVLSVGDHTFQRKCLERMRSIISNGATVIFVSHNLMAVGNLCSQSLLIDAGRVTKLGPTDEVITSYMNSSVARRQEVSEDSDIFISKVAIGDEKGDRVQFQSGQKAWIKVEIRAKRKCEELSVALYFRDYEYYGICKISTERMGQGTFSMDAGEMAEFIFELDLHFGGGAFHIGAMIYQSSIQKIYDEWFPATTIFVSCDGDVRGAVNLHPKVEMRKVHVP